jgi:acetyl esterase
MNRINLLVVTFLIFSGSVFSQNETPTPLQIRAAIAGEISSFQIPAEAIFKIENKMVRVEQYAIKIRIYTPDSAKNKRIIFNIHGGALVAGDLETHENISRVLANRTHAIVVAVDYRKPPEFPFPASINDCDAVYTWIKANATTFNGNPNDIILLGESGGGLLVASLMVKNQQNPGLKAVCLINPAVDLRNFENPLYNLVKGWYLNKMSDSDSLASPTMATQFSHYPSTLIITCEKDELKAQAVTFSNKLNANKVEFLDIKNEDHLGGLWAANHPAALPALEKTVQFIASIK